MDIMTPESAEPVRAHADRTGSLAYTMSPLYLLAGLLVLAPLGAQAAAPASAGPAGASMPSSFLEGRLELCHSSRIQRKGCGLAFRYLAETALSGKTGHLSSVPPDNPTRDFHDLAKRLRAAGYSESEWVTGAFNAWLAALDPHAKMVSAKESDSQASAEKILVQGAGAKLRIYRDRVYVAYSIEGSAAESIGLRPGDRVLALNGQEFQGLSETGKRRWLRDAKPPYRLVVEREGQELSLAIAEKRYYLANVESRVRERGGTREGIIRVRSFGKENTCRELRAAVEELEGEKVERLRLNLNDNPGGLVREAQCAAGLFLGGRKAFARLIRQDNRAARELIPAALTSGNFDDSDRIVLRTTGPAATALPLVVEINQNTASAAEMLAASLQDNHRASITGTRSFGKGTMQSVFHPWSSPKLYLTRTTHRILRPSGQPLQFAGVSPDTSVCVREGENFPRERELTL